MRGVLSKNDTESFSLEVHRKRKTPINLSNDEYIKNYKNTWEDEVKNLVLLFPFRENHLDKW